MVVGVAKKEPHAVTVTAAQRETMAVAGVPCHHATFDRDAVHLVRGRSAVGLTPPRHI